MRTQYAFILLVLFCSCGTRKKISHSTTTTTTTIPSKSNSYLEKYSALLKTPVYNTTLYSTIDQWMGVPYKYGGKDKSGVDCSHFTCSILKEAFGFSEKFYYPSAQLAEKATKIEESELQEGDLIFFNINQNSKISHVGIFLKNRRFVHASTSKGVVISSLDESYYKARIAYFGRIEK